MNTLKEYLKNSLKLYAISDRSWIGSQTLLEQIEDSFKGGVSFFQLREKDLDYAEFLAEAKAIRALCSKYNVPFVINDNVQIAKESNADGVHLGQSDMKIFEAREILGENKIIGISAKTLEQALEAEKYGADYLGVGAAFSTFTKKDAAPLEHSVIKEICERVSIPVVAIGGINLDNISLLRGLGLSGFAIISDIYSAKNIKERVEILNKKIEEIL